MTMEPDMGGIHRTRLGARNGQGRPLGIAHNEVEHVPDLYTPRTQPRILAILTTGDLVRRTNLSIRIGRPEGPTAVMMFPILPSIKVGKVRLGVRAFEYDDPQARAGVHSREQILEGFEYAVVYDVERRVIEHIPPVRGRFLDNADRPC